MKENTIKMLADWFSIISGIMTIIGIPGIAIWGFSKRFKNLSGLRIYRVSIFILKFGAIVLYLAITLALFSVLYYFLLLPFVDPITQDNLYWNSEAPLGYIFSYFVTGCFYLFTAVFGSACIFSGSIKPLSAIKENWKTFHITIERSRYKDVKIIDAKYGAQNNYKDVLPILNEVMTESKLEFFVGNELFTDPIPGVVKELFITIEIDGKTKNLKYKEGQKVLLQFDE